MPKFLLAAVLVLMAGTRPSARARAWGGVLLALAIVTAAPARSEPIFYFVLHADPAPLSTIESTSWVRLVDFMQDLKDRNDVLVAAGHAPHRVTIMFSPAWGQAIRNVGDGWPMIQEWHTDGHEFAFHSHSQNHRYRDGYSNVLAWAQTDRDIDPSPQPSNCVDAPASPGAPPAAWASCTLDAGLDLLQTELDAALAPIPEEATLAFARVGPPGNSGNAATYLHDNSCNAVSDGAGGFLPDDFGCLSLEWTGELADRIPYTTLAYDVEHSGRNNPGAVLGESLCVDWTPGDGGADALYGIPHAPFQTESGELRVSLERLTADLLDAADGDMVGVVIHPVSYATGLTPRLFDDDTYGIVDNVAYIGALFDFLDGFDVGIVNGMVSETGTGSDQLDLVDGQLVAPIRSLTLSEARLADLAAQQPQQVVCGAQAVPSFGRNPVPLVAVLALGLALAGFFALFRKPA